MEKESKYILGFNEVKGLGGKTLLKIKNHFGDFESAWRKGSRRDFGEIGLKPDLIDEILQKIKTSNLNQALETLAKNQIKLLSFEDEAYPRLLSEIADPPILLFYKGVLTEDPLPLAMVGARKPTFYGQSATTNIGMALAESGVTIVSGLAYGIDALAHLAALKAKKRTVAVIGSGLDEKSFYPKENKKLAEEILVNGGNIFSEYSAGTPPTKGNFPARNRIISGLSLGTIIIEAAKGSGSLITAELALEQNREVFALPGNINNDNAYGPNQLIKGGAKMITGVNDILEELNIEARTEYSHAQKTLAVAPEEKVVVQFLGMEPIHIDKLARDLKFDSAKVASILTLLEMKGVVKNIGADNYVLNK